MQYPICNVHGHWEPITAPIKMDSIGQCNISFKRIKLFYLNTSQLRVHIIDITRQNHPNTGQKPHPVQPNPLDRKKTKKLNPIPIVLRYFITSCPSYEVQKSRNCSSGEMSSIREYDSKLGPTKRRLCLYQYQTRAQEMRYCL